MPDPPPFRDVAQWRFQDAGDGYYYIVDRRHGAALGAGTDFDHDIHHYKDLTGREEAQWKLVAPTSVRVGKGVRHLVDRKHGKALLTGDAPDGKLYHGDAFDRSSALWTLVLASDGEGGPKDYIAKQRLLALSYGYDAARRVEQPPTMVVDRLVSVDEGAQRPPLNPSWVEKDTETVTLQHAVTAGLMVSVCMVESAGGVLGKVESKLEVRTEFGFQHTKVATTERSLSYRWSVPAKSVGKPVRVRAVLRRQRQDIPFEATVETTYGDGTVSTEKVPGTWSNTSYTSGEISFTEQGA